jgi:hypothetical protein
MIWLKRNRPVASDPGRIAEPAASSIILEISLTLRRNLPILPAMKIDDAAARVAAGCRCDGSGIPDVSAGCVADEDAGQSDAVGPGRS